METDLPVLVRSAVALVAARSFSVSARRRELDGVLSLDPYSRGTLLPGERVREREGARSIVPRFVARAEVTVDREVPVGEVRPVYPPELSRV